MNNVFDISRFGKLLNKHLKEQWKTYVMSILVLVGGLFIIIGLVTYLNNGSMPVKMQSVLFALGFLGSGTIFTSMIFSDLGNKTKAIPLLTLPVSHFERFLVGWLFSFVIFQLVYLLSFYLADFTIMTIAGKIADVHNQLMRFSDPELHIENFYKIFALFHSIAFLGAIFFEKLHFIKSGFLFMLGVFGVMLINLVQIDLLFDNKVTAFLPFVVSMVRENENRFELEPTATMISYLSMMVYVLVLIFWTATYFKLKEKQV